jgi:2-hydroxy-6-oxonona-2,4-dienedioate hydrolase
MSSFWVELLGARIHQLKGRYSTRAIEIGEGAPLLLVHGTGGHAENYIRNIVPFSRHFRVIAIDLLWHGRSQTTGFSPEVLPPLVDQLRDVLDTLKIERAHLEGQSLGGWVAMLFAVAHPQRLSKLIVTTPMGYRPDLGAVPGYVEPNPLPLRENTLAVLREPSYANIKSRLERIVFDPSVVTDESIRVRQSFYNDPAVNAVQRELTVNYLGGAEPQKHAVTDAVAKRISAPTLVYWGDKNFIPPAVGMHLARTIPKARFFSAPATGHWAQFENFEVHNREVLRFLTDKEQA